MSADHDQRSVRFAEAAVVWIRVALLSFGGPAGQIAVMHRIVVDEKQWVSETRFLHALNYCMLLPGPEAQQLATYLGWLLHGVRGGLFAGIAFVLPGFIAIALLSVAYVLYQDTPLINGLFFGLKAAVLAVIVQAVFLIGRRILRSQAMVGIAGLAFIAIFCFQMPFPAVIACAACIGFVGHIFRPASFHVLSHSASIENVSESSESTRWSRSLMVLCFGASVWALPVVASIWLLGFDHVFSLEAVFFSKAAVVTFGGAYAVLAYIAQQAVERYQWMLPGEMLDGLAMAETTPGPLIMVVQFVGFMGAYRNPGPMDPLLAGLVGSVVTTWVTFAPCFLWIFLGAPFIERLRSVGWLTSALSAVTAAVVGVIGNLALWFAFHVLFGESESLEVWVIRMDWPVWATIDGWALVLAGAAALALLRLKWSLLMTLLVATTAGLLVSVIR